MMFTALHVQTANPNSASVCAIGWAQVGDSEVTGSGSFLCIPPEQVDWFSNDFTTATEGLFAYDVAEAPTFAQLHPLLAAIVGGADRIVSLCPDSGIAALAAASTMCGLDAPACAGTDLSDWAHRSLGVQHPTLAGLAARLGVPVPTHGDDEHYVDAGQEAVAVAMIALSLAEAGDLPGCPSKHGTRQRNAREHAASPRSARHLAVLP